MSGSQRHFMRLFNTVRSTRASSTAKNLPPVATMSLREIRPKTLRCGCVHCCTCSPQPPIYPGSAALLKPSAPLSDVLFDSPQEALAAVRNEQSKRRNRRMQLHELKRRAETHDDQSRRMVA